jgi:predicted Zn-dependent protease
MQDYPTAEKLLASIPSGFSDQPRLQYTLALVEYHAAQFDQSQRILESLIASGNKNAAILNLLKSWAGLRLNRLSIRRVLQIFA